MLRDQMNRLSSDAQSSGSSHTAISIRAAREVDAPAKVALLERLLAVPDVAECIEHTLAWLVSHTNATQVICALARNDTGLLTGVAGRHVTTSQVGSVSAPLDDTNHPLIRAMYAPEASFRGSTLGDGGAGHGPTPAVFGTSSYWIWPLETHGAGQSAGGLLLVMLDGEPTDDVVWLAAILSQKLQVLLMRDALAEGQNAFRAKVVAATAELARQNRLLRTQAMELEEASRLKSQFLANMSHELRTPLNAILGYASILLQGISGDLTPGQRKALDRIASNGRHLVGIISEILDLSRIEAGRMPLQTSTFALKQLVDEVLAETDPMIARSKLTVIRQVAPDLEPIVSDRQKVKQIILNLLSNALKFTREGSVTINVAYADTTTTETIAITDTGIGIDPKNHDKIFDDFQQVDSSVARQYGGTGLGLSICRRLATMLGGRLDVESEVGRGSTFTLALPVRLRK
jgi:signal transduction histidine kinase